jgi:hypothetical protein
VPVSNFALLILAKDGTETAMNTMYLPGHGDIWLAEQIEEDNEEAARQAAVEELQAKMLDDNEWVAEAVGENCLPNSELIGTVMLYLRDKTLRTQDQLVKIGEAVTQAAYDYTYQRAKEDV